MKISEKLNLNLSQLQLDFYDYNYNLDNDIYFDPYFIKNSSDPLVQKCNQYIISFFNHFLFLNISGREREARDLFIHLNESNDVSMGMSKGVPRGKGIGISDSNKIVDEILNSLAFKNNMLNDIEDIKLFIDGIGKDKISDMITNLIRFPLIEYTIDQCNLWGIKLLNGDSYFYWDLEKCKWNRCYIKRLVIDNKYQLLYPKSMISSSDNYVAKRFFDMYILESLKQVYIDKKSSLVKVKYDKYGNIIQKNISKKAIRDDLEEQGEFFSKTWIANFAKYNPDVFKLFKKDTINHMTCISNELTTEEDIEEVINTLKKELMLIKPGVEDANRYHKFMSGVLELIFYPYLAHPKLEDDIHQGRKRIDITFNNVAESGFFFLLGTNYNVPCSLIAIECKNYAKDIKNPELDQIAGRFNAKVGKFGIICCRTLDDESLFIKRECDTFKDDRGLIIHLTDEDILELLEIKKNRLSISDFFIKKYREIVLC